MHKEGHTNLIRPEPAVFLGWPSVGMAERQLSQYREPAERRRPTSAADPRASSRRWRSAGMFLLVAFLTSAVWLYGVEAADEAPAVASSPPPVSAEPSPPFGVPEPHPGDQGSYVLSVVAWSPTDSWLIEDQDVLLNFSLHRGEWMPDMDGQPRWVNRIAIGLPPWQDGVTVSTGNVLLLLDSATGRLAAVGDGWVDQRIFDYGSGASAQETLYDETIRILRPDEGLAAPCAFRNALQGREVPIAEPVRLFEDCWPLVGGPSDAAQEYRATARGAMDSHEIVEYRPASESGTENPNSFVVFARDVPFPLWIGQQRTDEPGIYDVARLSTFARGINVEDPAPPPAATPLEWRPLHPWGVEDVGIDHPIPASEAFRRALDHPSGAELKLFLEKHPNARPASMSYTEGESDYFTHWGSTAAGPTPWPRYRGWSFLLAEGNAGFRVCAEQTVPVDRDGVEIEAAAVDQSCPMGDYNLEGSDYEDMPPAPLQGPTATSLQAAWSATGAIAEHRGFASWGLGRQLRCPPGNDTTGWARTLVPRNESRSSGPCSLEPVFQFSVTTKVDQDNGTGVEGDQFASSGTRSVTLDATGRVESLESHGWMRSDAWNSPTASAETFAPSLPHVWPDQPPAGPREDLTAAVLTKEPVSPPILAAATGLAGLLATLLYWKWPQLKATVASAFYARLAPDALLRHPTRQKILEILRSNPGLHFRELQRRLGTSNGLALHHLHVLLRTGHVQEQPAGGFTCYFVTGAVDRRLVPALAALRAPSARALLAVVVENPGLTFTDLARRLNVSPKAIAYHADRLTNAGLLVNAGRLREAQVSSTELGKIAARSSNRQPPGSA